MIRIAFAAFATLLLGGCISAQSWEATRLLRDIEAGAEPSSLKERTPDPTRQEMEIEYDGRSMLADLYHPNQEIGARLVLVPGFTPEGKNDPRLVQFANSLARTRFLVLVPDIEGIRELTVQRGDAVHIADAAHYLAELEVEQARDNLDVGVAGLSYAVGLSVLATKEPHGEEAVDFLLGVGAYYDTENVLTFATTGEYQLPDTGEWQHLEPEHDAKWLFLRGNLDILEDPQDREILSEVVDRRMRDPDASLDDLAPQLGEEGRSLLDLMINEDRERVPELLAEVPESAREDLEALSLSARDLSHLHGDMILIHGREDTMIPYTESIRLAEAAGDAELHLISGFSHIDPGGIGLWGQWQLLGGMMDVLDRRVQ